MVSLLQNVKHIKELDFERWEEDVLQLALNPLLTAQGIGRNWGSQHYLSAPQPQPCPIDT